MSNKHTPGPWSVYPISGRNGYGIESTERSVVNHIDFAMNDKYVIDRYADARLIAAAPDLLAALRGVLSAISNVEESWEDGNLAESVNALLAEGRSAEDAIGKATL